MLTQESNLAITQDISAIVSDNIETEAANNADKMMIENRFGVFEFHLKNTLTLPSGLVGMPDITSGGFIKFPDDRLSHLVLFQSFSEPYSTFISMPIAVDSGLLEKADIEQTAKQLGISMNNLVIFGLITIRKIPESKITVNLRAPLFVDVDAKTVHQIVLNNSKYNLQTPIILQSKD